MRSGYVHPLLGSMSLQHLSNSSTQSSASLWVVISLCLIRSCGLFVGAAIAGAAGAALAGATEAALAGAAAISGAR